MKEIHGKETIVANARQDVPDAELTVLQALWKLGTARLGRLTAACYPGEGSKRNTTVLKLLVRLQEKGYVTRQGAKGVRTFRATITQPELINLRQAIVAEKLSGGSRYPLAINLVDKGNLTPDELQLLRRRIDDILKGNRKRR